jgi:hypothetical protein
MHVILESRPLFVQVRAMSPVTICQVREWGPPRAHRPRVPLWDSSSVVPEPPGRARVVRVTRPNRLPGGRTRKGRAAPGLRGVCGPFRVLHADAIHRSRRISFATLRIAAACW